MSKIVNESLNEAFKFDGHEFSRIKISDRESIYVGEDGILGYKNTFIPWEIIKKIAKHYE